ncbi:MAG: hypothetical protein HZB91_09630 [Elusimicrobia bacterium]|nr:hypothetical protein [Elusimicrobiota bacterium]
MSAYGAMEHASRLKESLFSKGLHTLIFQPAARTGPHSDDLSHDEISTFCDTLGPLPSLIMAGPEPFLRPDLYRVARTFLLRNKVRRLFVHTDGSLHEVVAAFVRDLLYAHPDLELSVKVSLDGEGDLHDKLKARPDAFNKALDTLDKLKRLKTRYSGLSVMVSTLISNENASAMPGLMDFVFNKVGPDRHEFDLNQSGPAEAPVPLPDIAALKRLHRSVLANKVRYLKRDGSGAMRRLAVLCLASAAQDLQRGRLSGSRRTVACSGGRNICEIGPGGGLRFCPARPAVGSLRAVGLDFRKLWNSEQAEAERAKHRLENCPWVGVPFLQAAVSAGALPALRLLLRLPFSLDNLP